MKDEHLENGTEKEHSWKILNRTRIKFGIASLLYNGDEAAFAPFHTVIIRALGGGDAHLGFIGAAAQVMAPMFSWVGAVLLRLMKFNRQAMTLSLWLGALIQAFIVILLVLVSRNAAWAGWGLYIYLSLIVLMLVLTGAQFNIGVCWIGDLVPKKYRGRFVSGMSIISVIGIVIMQFALSRLALLADGLYAYAGIMGLIFVNTVISVFLFWTVPNRRSQAVKFVSTHKEERLDYRYPPLWHLIWFECTWRGGRIALMSFTTAYLLDYFGMRLDRVILLNIIGSTLSIFSLFVVGRISDRVGNQRPLMLISFVCALSMLLWVSTAWWGIWPIVAYQVINGAAGVTHWMLVNNLSLEVYPAKGRPNYLSFHKSLSGVFLLIFSTYAGHLLSGFRGWSTVLWGSEINHYHVFFLICTAVTLACIIPLGLLGRYMSSPAYHEEEDDEEPAPLELES